MDDRGITPEPPWLPGPAPDDYDDPPDYDPDVQRCDCGAEVDSCEVAECAVCHMQGCSACLHDGGDDIYDTLCSNCDP